MIILDGNHSVMLYTPVRIYDMTSLHNLYSNEVNNILEELRNAWDVKRSLPEVRRIINEWILTDPDVQELKGGVGKYYIFLKGRTSIIENIFSRYPDKIWTGSRIVQPINISNFELIPKRMGLKRLNYRCDPKWPERITEKDKKDIEIKIRNTLCELLDSWETYQQISSTFTLNNIRTTKKLINKFSQPENNRWGDKFCYSFISLYISYKLGLV